MTTADSTANRRSPFEDGTYAGAPKLPTTKSEAFPNIIAPSPNGAAAGALASAGAPIVLDEDDYHQVPRPTTAHNNNNATVSGTGGSKDRDVGDFDEDLQPAVDVNYLQRRLAAAEAESARHVQIISSMHEWAYKTTTSLRQVQEKCENAENRAKVAESEVNSLKHQLTQVAAQVEAMAVAVGSPSHAAAAHGGGGAGANQNGEAAQSKRRRKKELPHVNTLTSLADDGQGNYVSPPQKTSMEKHTTSRV
jgi:hypothetical protein